MGKTGKFNCEDEFDNKHENKLKSGLTTAFIDEQYSSAVAYRPEFVSNDYRQGKKVITTLENELKNCDAFCISVAFINLGGVAPLLQTFLELQEKNVPGKILTTDYQMFTQPEALDKLHKLSNISLRMYETRYGGPGFHTKGYIFRKGKIYRIITGSSNLTQSALTSNFEWNTKLVSSASGEMTKSIIKEFDDLWNSQHSRDYKDFIEEYREDYITRQEIIKEQHKAAMEDNVVSLPAYRLEPNKMQTAFVTKVKELYKRGEHKGLLISATGTGKTFASAFAMRSMGFKRVLFLVHRNQIAGQALLSYRKVLGNGIRCDLYTGPKKTISLDDINKAGYIFANIFTFCKSEVMHKFSPDFFDCIIYDEAHHDAASSYKKVLDYFHPRFMLGMTATPDRRDDNIEGRNIYEIFDHNIIYEIRLQQAMEEDLLCPFHYFGISDIELLSKEYDEKDPKFFSYLTSDERVRHVMEKAEFFGYSGSRVKGLIFVSRIEEAEELSRKFNERGWKTAVVSGRNSEAEREDLVDRLTQENKDGNELDYLLSVDVFSEGVDIPEINQVIMLRPTQSPIVFIQQLGRGLRKYQGKDYLIVLDFVMNSENNFMIPIALSGDRTYNKDTVRRYVMEGNRVIPGSSTIHFDEVSRENIYRSIDQMSTQRKKFLSEKYFTLKDRLGRIPTMVEFYRHGEIDPLKFIDYSGSYYQFLKSVDKDYKEELDVKDKASLEFVSRNFADGKRIYELLILKELIKSGRVSESDICSEIEKSGDHFSEESFRGALNVLDGGFVNTMSEKKKYQNVDILFADKTGFHTRLNEYYRRASEAPFIKYLEDAIGLGMCRYNDIYRPGKDENGFSMYKKYSRRDVCRILNWDHDDSSTIYGYRIKYNTCPIFVTYNKNDDISESTKYDDRFMDDRTFSWMTRSKVSLKSAEAQKIINYDKSGLKIFLFIKKSDDEGSDFYYMGRVRPAGYRETTQKDNKGHDLPIVNFRLELENEVREDIYEYFLNG